MKEQLLELARTVCATVQELRGGVSRRVARPRPGDPHYEVDEVAEKTVQRQLKQWDLPVALFSEDRGLVPIHPNPKWILIVDPIDGTRPTLAGFESACFSAAVAPYSTNPRFGDIRAAVVAELTTGHYFYADEDQWESSHQAAPALSNHTDLASMFWSIELTAHPIRRLADVYGDMVDGSVTRGAVFVFTSASYSLTRIITGQLDAHVDIGHGILQRAPSTSGEFRRVGGGELVTLYPYDIAGAAYLLERAGGCVSDAFGEPLSAMPLLTDKSLDQQCSLVAAGNPTLHREILEQLRWEALENNR